MNRIVGLDLLRAIIMIFGPTYHASMLMEGSFGFEGYFSQTDVTKTLLFYTNQFRMELFFIISGFFASLVIEKKGVNKYEVSRKDRILKPTLVSLVTILPLTCLLMYSLQGYKDFDGYISYRHLWFLVTLSLISIMTLIGPSFWVTLAKKTASFFDGFNFIFLSFSFCVVFFLFHVISILANKALPGIFNVLLQVENVIKFIVPFLFGMILYFVKIKPSKFFIALFPVLFTLWYFSASLFLSDDYLPKPVPLFIKDFFSSMMCISIFYFFYDLNLVVNKYISELSRIALPFYLLHLPILILLSNIYWNVSEYESDVLFSFVVIPSTIVLSFVISWVLTKNSFIKRGLGLI